MNKQLDYTDILIDIRRIVRSINLESKRIQKDMGISIPQLLCLNFLSNCPDFMSTHRELTRFLHLNSSTVTGIINRLEQKSLLARLPKKGDKRVTNIALTSTGSKVLDSSPDLLHEKLNKKLSALPEDKVSTIKNALNELVKALEIDDLEASPVITMEEPIMSKE